MRQLVDDRLATLGIRTPRRAQIELGELQEPTVAAASDARLQIGLEAGERACLLVIVESREHRDPGSNALV